MGNQLIREQIIEILESDYCDGGPTIGSIADKIEHLVNLEVEKRIKERMPTKGESHKKIFELCAMPDNLGKGLRGVISAPMKYEIFDDWFRSRLTNSGVNDSQKQTHQVTPQVPHKTEGGGE